MNERVQENWASLRINEKIPYSPKVIRKDEFSYTFDAVFRNADKAVFVKVFKNPHDSCKKEELLKIIKAINLINDYYDSYVYLFTKRRFSDYAYKRAPKDDTISLVEIERLRY